MRGRPPTSPEVIALIEEMAVKNRTWRAPRIKGELLKLGIVVYAERSTCVGRERGLPPRKPGQTWARFIKNHARGTWACDFVQTDDLFVRAVFVYFTIELGSRRIVQYGVTRSPNDFWVAQQVRAATSYEEGPRFLIRDNDGKYGQCFNRVTRDRGIAVLRTRDARQRPMRSVSGSSAACGKNAWIIS
jgi:putative transposase